MKFIYLKTPVLLIAIGLVGCAAGGKQPAEHLKNQTVEQQTVGLKCTSAYRQGCRYQGQILPWNDWAAALGYNKEQYAVSKVSVSGGQAMVLVTER